MKLHVMAIYHIEKEMKENISILDAPDDVMKIRYQYISSGNTSTFSW